MKELRSTEGGAWDASRRRTLAKQRSTLAAAEAAKLEAAALAAAEKNSVAGKFFSADEDAGFPAGTETSPTQGSRVLLFLPVLEKKLKLLPRSMLFFLENSVIH